MRVRERDRERVGRIRLQLARQLQQQADHVLDLGLVAGAGADDRLLDLARGVFVHADAATDECADRRAARLAELERGIGIARHEHALDRGFLRRVLADDHADAVEDALEAIGEMIALDELERGVEHMRGAARGIDVDDADAGAAAARINADDANHRARIRH